MYLPSLLLLLLIVKVVDAVNTNLPLDVENFKLIQRMFGQFIRLSQESEDQTQLDETRIDSIRETLIIPAEHREPSQSPYESNRREVPVRIEVEGAQFEHHIDKLGVKRVFRIHLGQCLPVVRLNKLVVSNWFS